MTKSTTCVIKLSPSYQIIFLAREAAQVNFADGKVVIRVILTSHERHISATPKDCDWLKKTETKPPE